MQNTWAKERKKYVNLWRQGLAQTSDYARQLRFLNHWITPEPRLNPWLEWQYKLLLQEEVLQGYQAQVQLFVYYQNQLQELTRRLEFAHDDLQQRTNQLRFREAQLRHQTQKLMILWQQNHEIAATLELVRVQKRENREVAIQMIRNVTQIFNDSIPKIQ